MVVVRDSGGIGLRRWDVERGLLCWHCHGRVSNSPPRSRWHRLRWHSHRPRFVMGENGWGRDRWHCRGGRNNFPDDRWEAVEEVDVRHGSVARRPPWPLLQRFNAGRLLPPKNWLQRRRDGGRRLMMPPGPYAEDALRPRDGEQSHGRHLWALLVPRRVGTPPDVSRGRMTATPNYHHYYGCSGEIRWYR